MNLDLRINEFLAQCKDLPTKMVPVIDHDAAFAALKEQGNVTYKGEPTALFDQCKAISMAVGRRGGEVTMKQHKVLDRLVAITLTLKPTEPALEVAPPKKAGAK